MTQHASTVSIHSLETIAPLLQRLLLHDPELLSGFFTPVEIVPAAPSTSTNIHCYCLTIDSQGRSRLKDLISAIALRVVEYVIPRSRIEEARKEKTVTQILRLEKEARSLFTTLYNTGEGGELLLYLLAETILKLPQLLCKMPLKTSTKLHIQGTDGIHAGVTDTGRLALYWGESKFHKSANSAIKDCFASLAPYLLDDGGSHSTQSRDLQLLRDHMDLNNPELESALRRFLDRHDPWFNKVECRGLALVGFDNHSYPAFPNVKAIEALVAEIRDHLKAWAKYTSERVTAENLHPFTIELFCLPFPSVEEFRAQFLKELGLANGAN